MATTQTAGETGPTPEEEIMNMFAGDGTTTEMGEVLWTADDNGDDGKENGEDEAKAF